MNCSICNWTNVSLVNLGDPEKPKMVCMWCCKRAIEAQQFNIHYNKAVAALNEIEKALDGFKEYIKLTESKG